MDGELCWYLKTKWEYTSEDNTDWCDPDRCKPVLEVPVSDDNNDFHPLDSANYLSYLIDEMTLGQVLDHKSNRAIHGTPWGHLLDQTRFAGLGGGWWCDTSTHLNGVLDSWLWVCTRR